MFQTRIEIPLSETKITYEDHIMTLGSCFAENIGKKMKDVYFDADINPFGILFNPVSICNSMELLLQTKTFTRDDIFEYNSMWQSFSHSSLFADSTSEGCLSKMNSRLKDAREFLSRTNVILLTFGTAWVFEDKKSGRVVSNCHKLPADKFIRRRLSVEEIVADYNLMINKLQSVYPTLNIIFSVSPVRHWKDGAHDNTISKSTLLLAIDELQKKLQKVHYFPAYEIQMDELRDYRFYAADMLHPSDVAVDYIWNRFSDTYFSKQTSALKRRLEQLILDSNHRPLHPDSIGYIKFLDKTEKRKEELIQEFPFLSGRI